MKRRDPRKKLVIDLLCAALYALLLCFLVIALVCWCAPGSREPEQRTSVPVSVLSLSEPLLQLPAESFYQEEPEEEEEEVVWTPDPADVELLAKVIWGEARGSTTMQQAAVVWCVLNRVDSDERYFPDTIREVVLQKNQFTGYKSSHPATAEFKALAEDVLHRWHDEKDGIGPECSVGRVLPKEYVYFHSAGLGNTFRKTLERNGKYWDWSLENPYEGVWH